MRALSAWDAVDPPLRPITLHQCRHTFASLMIASGANAKRYPSSGVMPPFRSLSTPTGS
jgi:integrase